MKSLPLVIAVCLCAAANGAERPPKLYKANTDPVEVDNAFARANPHYKERAGAFYEEQYLDKATWQLLERAGVPQQRLGVVRLILRAYVYDWLDAYVRDNGAMRPEKLEQVLGLMDERFEGELSQEQFQRYLAWRKDATGAHNPLAFLMLRPLARPRQGWRPQPRVAYRSALLGYGKRWGRMVETHGKLFAAVGSGVLRLDVATGRWKLLIAPEKHPHAKIYNVRAGAAHVYVAGSGPLLWQIDLAAETVRELPIEACLKEAGLAKYNGVRDVLEAGGHLWLSVSHRDYEGPLLEYDPKDGAVRPAPPVPEGSVQVGWSDQLVADGDILWAVGHVKSGSYVVWRLDTRARTWTHRRLPLPKKDRYLSAKLLRRPGEWWAISGGGGLVIAMAEGCRFVPPPGPASRYGYGGAFFVGDRALLFWARNLPRERIPFLYLIDKGQWLLAAPLTGKEGFQGAWDHSCASATGAWFADNYTLYHFRTSELTARLDGPSPKDDVSDYFTAPWPQKTIGYLELEDLARTCKVRSRAPAIVEVSEAPVHDKEDGHVVRRLRLGDCVLIDKWLDGHGQLAGPGVRTLTPHPRLADPTKRGRKPSGWHSVLLPDGARGWMRGEHLLACPMHQVDAAPAGEKVTARLSPHRETAQSRVVSNATRGHVRDLVEIERSDAQARVHAELWACVDSLVGGNPPLIGWVSAKELRLGFVAVQRSTAMNWAQAHTSDPRNADTERAVKARTLLERMAKEHKDTAFMHPGIFDGGGPRECHAGYQAQLDLALCYAEYWGDREKALSIYAALEREKTDANAYQGKVPAWAAFQRAELLWRMKRYEDALAAYRLVVTKHAGRYWTSGMYLPADRRALWRMKEICVNGLKDPERWRREAKQLGRETKKE